MLEPAVGGTCNAESSGGTSMLGGTSDPFQSHGNAGKLSEQGHGIPANQPQVIFMFFLYKKLVHI